MSIFFPPLISLLGACVIPFIKRRVVRNVWTETVTLASAVLVWIIALPEISVSSPAITLFSIAPGYDIAFCLDGASRFFLLLISFLWPLAVLYAFEYMSHEHHEKKFFTYYTLTFGITQLLSLSANLITLYIFYELLSLVTLPLVIHHEDEDSFRSGMTYVKFTVGSASLGLFALIALSLFSGNGYFTPGGMLDGTVGSETLIRVIFLVAFLGFAVKAAVFPLCFWLPRASVAPTPVTALLHAVAVVNSGVFAAIRLIYYTFGTNLLINSFAQTVSILLSVVTILFGAVMAIREQHLKRRLAWSTVSNLGYMLFSACIMTEAGLTGAMTHMFFHSLMKITLFYCAGVFLIQTGKEYLTQLRGIGKKMPVTVVVFLVSGIALTGIPPFVGFISKYTIITAALDLGNTASWIGAVSLILSSVMACVYLLEPAIQMSFMAPVASDPGNTSAQKSDPGPMITFTLVILCLLILLLGMFSDPLTSQFAALIS